MPESGDDEIAAVAAALNRLAETLQQEEALRKESVADLAHELRTPVMGILARVEAAQDGVLEDDAANLSAMHDEALRLSRLLDDLSALAEAERPGLLLDAEPVDLAAIARAQTAAFAGAFADKGIALAADLRPAPVNGEPKRLEQIVVNLLSNALRYTDAGGRVLVTVRPDAGGDALLEVSDTGIGIADGGPAARLHPLLARREVALTGHRRRGHRAVDRQGARAGARRRGRRGERAGAGVPVPRHAAAVAAGVLLTPPVFTLSPHRGATLRPATANPFPRLHVAQARGRTPSTVPRLPKPHGAGPLPKRPRAAPPRKPVPPRWTARGRADSVR